MLEGAIRAVCLVAYRGLMACSAGPALSALQASQAFPRLLLDYPVSSPAPKARELRAYRDALTCP